MEEKYLKSCLKRDYNMYLVKCVLKIIFGVIFIAFLMYLVFNIFSNSNFEYPTLNECTSSNITGFIASECYKLYPLETCKYVSTFASVSNMPYMCVKLLEKNDGK